MKGKNIIIVFLSVLLIGCILIIVYLDGYLNNYKETHPIKVTVHPPEFIAITNTSTSTIDFTVDSSDFKDSVSVELEPAIVYKILNGVSYTTKKSDLDEAIRKADRPCFFGAESISLTYDPEATTTTHNMTVLLFNPLDSEVKVVFGVDTDYPELFKLPESDQIEPKSYKLYNFEMKIYGGYEIYHARIFVDYYIHGVWSGRTYQDENYSGNAPFKITASKD